MIGIVGYGAYVPIYRIKSSTIANQWGDDPASIEKGLMLLEKTVPGPDEDTITIAIAAAKNALKRARIDPQKIGAVYIGSESHPYAVKPSGTVLIDALCIRDRYWTTRPRCRFRVRLQSWFRSNVCSL